jgi:predicted Zn-dependent protease
VLRRFQLLVRRIRRDPARALAMVVLLALIGAGLGLAAMHGWAAWQCHLAEEAGGRRDFAGAYNHYLSALKIWGGRPGTHLEAAQAARRADLIKEAEEHLTRCQALQGGPSGDLQMERILLRAQIGDLGPIESELRELTKQQTPEAAQVIEALAKGYRVQLRWRDAQHCLLELIRREPNNVWAHFFRAHILVDNNSEDAFPALRKVLELDPNHHQARLLLAQGLLRLDAHEALRHFERLRAPLGDNPELLLGLAQTYRSLGRSKEALKALDALLARDPDNAKGLVERGSIDLDNDRPVEAERWFRKAVAAAPAFPDAYHQLAQALRQQPGKEAEAKRFTEMHKRVWADNIRLTHIGGKDMNEQPNNPDLLAEVGAIYMRLGHKTVASQWLLRALQIDRTHQLSHRLLMQYYREVGRPKQAEVHRSQLRPETAPTPNGQ